MKLNKTARLRVLIVLSCSIILLCGTGITYSLFISDSNLIANQKVAKFVFDAKKTDLIELPLNNLNPGDKMDYKFQVANNLNNKKSEVTISYQMIIKTYHFMPLKLELYKVEEDVEKLILTCDESYGRNQENQVLCNTNIQKLAHNDKNADDYIMRITFPAEFNSESYTELVDYVDIEIKSWQTTGVVNNEE